MNGLKVKVSVELSLSPREWQLYSMDGVNAAAKYINLGVSAAINSADGDREAARSQAHKVLARYSDFGAADTEPRGVLEDVLDRVYGREF